MPTTLPLRHALVSAALAATGLCANAHDSWLAPTRGQPDPHRLVIEASTGNRYPVQEFNPTPASLVRAECSDGKAKPLALRVHKEHDRWMALSLGAARHPPMLACWAEFKPYTLEMAAPMVQVYFNEIRAGAALRETWSALLARQLPWRESYRKFMRIELALPAGTTPAQIAAARQPVGLALELVLRGSAAVTPNQPLEFLLLRDGAPLAGLPVELVSERSPLGVWRTTDADGVVRHTLPFAGRWLVRAVDLRLSDEAPESWSSRFVTLALEAR